jgi:hypothetical protein
MHKHEPLLAESCGPQGCHPLAVHQSSLKLMLVLMPTCSLDYVPTPTPALEKAQGFSSAATTATTTATTATLMQCLSHLVDVDIPA